jgi:hypothetical protein
MRIRIIKELQQKRFLPLHAIKAILGDGHACRRGNEVQTLLELDGKLFQRCWPSRDAPGGAP